MSFPKDFDPKVRPSENSALSPLEQAQRYAENHIKDEKQESSRFQAFADYTDYYIAQIGLRQGALPDSYDRLGPREVSRAHRMGFIAQEGETHKKQVMLPVMLPLRYDRDFDGEVRTERQRENSLANIEETIRKRSNKIPGYRKELSTAKSLVWELEDAHKQSPYNTTNVFGAVRDLMRIKGEALERYSQSSVPPPNLYR